MIYDHECMCGTWVGDFSPPAMNGFDEIPTKIQFVNNKVESLIQTFAHCTFLKHQTNNNETTF